VAFSSRAPPRSPSLRVVHPLIMGLIYYTKRRQGLLEVPFPPIINRWLVWNRRHRLFFTKTPDRRYARARWACRTNDKSTWATTAAATTDAARKSLSTIHKLPRLHSDFVHKFTYIYYIVYILYGIQLCVYVCACVCKTPWITNFYIIHDPRRMMIALWIFMLHAHHTILYIFIYIKYVFSSEKLFLYRPYIMYV